MLTAAFTIRGLRNSLLICSLFGILVALIAYGRGGVKDILTPEERLWLTKNQSRIFLAVETG